MKKMVRGSFAILALSALTACVDDPLAPLNGDPDRVHNSRPVAWTKVGDSVEVLLRLVNDLNNATPTKFTISDVGAGIFVSYDAKYRPEYVGGSDTLIVPEIKSQQRYYVRGLAAGVYNYTATADGIAGTFKVRVEPANLGAALAPAAGAAGSTVTLTAPQYTKFTFGAAAAGNSGGSQVTWATGAAPTSELASADGKTITVTLASGQSGVATVTLVQIDLPGLTGTLPTATLSTTNSLTLVP